MTLEIGGISAVRAAAELLVGRIVDLVAKEMYAAIREDELRAVLMLRPKTPRQIPTVFLPATAVSASHRYWRVVVV